MVAVDSGRRQVIDAPPAQPPLYSLLNAATPVEDGVRWQLGVIWSPEQVFGGAAVAANCAGNTPGGKPRGHNPMRNTADPITVFAEDHCSTIGFEARDYEGRARRQLASVQSALIARELQLGTIRDAEGLSNVALIDGTEVGPGSSAVEDAIAMLEGALADTFAGARTMIHVTPGTLTEMMRKNLIYQAGQKWLTAPGNVVVCDAGYAAETTPEGAVFAYGTAMVSVRLSPVDLVPGTFEAAMAQMVDRSVNEITLYAERLALVQFDHSDQTVADLVFKVEVDVPAWHVGS